MQANELVRLLNADVLAGSLPDEDFLSACATDFMSDALMASREHMVMLTGLINAHTIRTAEMLDVRMIVYVRGKKPPIDVLEMAQLRDICAVGTRCTMYETCGILYHAGLAGK